MRLTRSLALLSACTLAAASTQQPLTDSDGHPKPDPPPYEFPLKFDNPRTDCKYVSQPWIADIFKNIANDFADVFKYVAPDVTFRIMGHHPFAGAYSNPKIAYINSLHRLNNCLKDNEVDSKLWAIHGGCDSEWTIMELYFNATTKRGLPWELTSLWVSRWDEDKLLREVRTYVDAGQIMRTLWDNEIWWNSSDRVTHYDIMPGPGGLPPGINASLEVDLSEELQEL
uniref:Dimerizing cyclase phiC n=1 Tax=Fungal sp. (strain ATCC 74256) TaxID=1729595 RepID=PHIC_FUNX7|nr:RecName: Full=Dimerizing cyclase phiC; AltName: Full=Phomoidride biosynthesis cluster protein C; Flags: Precursor [fungal sp. ATCC 74256]BBG28500.1 putative hypothetical protein [fungal sp. ATCC 74256]